MIIVVTGAFGFIGSNIIIALNKLGYNDIIAVDDLTDSRKMLNLAQANILDFVDKDDFIIDIVNGDYDNQIDYIFHQGACSDTTCQDGKYMMKNNYEYSILLLEYSQKNEIPLLYASSASVYGGNDKFIEDKQYENPLNIYAYSKFLFDQTVRRYYDNGLNSPVVGLRYFNVYGAREKHKDKMASVVLHNFNQYMQTGKVRLFKGINGYGHGEQKRDFVSITDVIKINLHFFHNHINAIAKEEVSGIFNCGTGVARTYNDLSLSVINACRVKENLAMVDLQYATNNNIIEYIDFPHELSAKYQCYTEANIQLLQNSAKFTDNFLSLEDGITEYINYLWINYDKLSN